MPRKKKEVVEEIKEAVVPMSEDAMNPPEVAPSVDVIKKIACGSDVNCRETPNGEKMFVIKNGGKVKVVEEVEVDGKKWSKIEGFVMSELLGEL